MTKSLIVGIIVIAAVVGGYLLTNYYYPPIDSTSNQPPETNESDTVTAEETLLSSEWVWQYTDLAQGGRVTAPAGEKFVLSFNQTASRMMSTTDCNSLSGNYVIDHEVLSFGDFTSTLMFCENSMETEYANHLHMVNSYTIGEDSLRFNMDRGLGTMVFHRK